MFLAVAHLPDSLVWGLPVLAHPIESLLDPCPEIIGNRQHIFVVQIQRVHQFAVNIALVLLVRSIADAHRARLLIAFPMLQFLLGQFGIAMDGKHRGDLLPRPRVFCGIVLYPVHEPRCFLRKADAHRRVHRECRVSQPRIPVIPVARAADHLRQARRRCGDDGARGLEGKQLQHQCRSLYALAPTSMVSTRRKPAVPELHRMLEQLFTLRLRCGAWRVAASFRIAYREDLRLAFLQRNFRNKGGGTALRNGTLLHSRAGSLRALLVHSRTPVYTPSGRSPCPVRTTLSGTSGGTTSTPAAIPPA